MRRSALLTLLSPALALQSSLILVAKPRGGSPLRSTVQSLDALATPVAVQPPSVAKLNNDTTLFMPGLQDNDAAQRKQELRQGQIKLIQRSATVSAACITTWLVTACFGLSTIQASSLLGVIGALTLSTPFAAANLCGSFAGMSAQMTSLDQVSVLAMMAGIIFYWFETKKLQLGKGGRLGTIACLANIFCFLVRDTGGPQRFVADLVRVLRPSTAVAVLASTFAVAAATHVSKKNSPTTVVEGRGEWKSPYLAFVQKPLFKVVLLSSLMARLVTTSGTSAALTKWSVTVASIFFSSLVTKMVTPWKGAVFATTAVGLAGSIFAGTALAPSIYLGGIMGMTSLQNFDRTSFLRASLLSATLLDLGLLNGFGGKLGLLSLLGVTFAK